jgi:hypothetical protein
MENTIVFNVERFKKWLFDLIESSYTLGIAYAETSPSFSKEEAIKRFQETLWGDLKVIWNIKE